MASSRKSKASRVARDSLLDRVAACLSRHVGKGERITIALSGGIDSVVLTDLLARLPEFRKSLEWVLKHRPEWAELISRWHEPGRGERRLVALLRGHRMKQVLRRMLDETEFMHFSSNDESPLFITN